MIAGTEIATLVRRHRERAGLTIEELSEASGVSVRAISNIERGVSRVPHRRNLAALADAIGVDEQVRAHLTDAIRAERERVRRTVDTVPRKSTKHFIGRVNELELIHSALAPPRAGNTVIVISGPPGIGKSRLAEHAAQVNRSHVDGKTVVVDLRGFDPVLPDRSLLLYDLLVGFGVAASDVPPSARDRERLYVDMLHEEHHLIVLDNAADDQDVAPLVPRDGRSTLIVTSRLALRATEADVRIRLDRLSVDESITFLQLAGGVPPADQDRRELGELAELCDHSPLALTIAAGRLRGRDGTLTRFVGQLRDANKRLIVLRTDDARLEASFEVSYQQLSRRARTVLVYATMIPTPAARADLIAVSSGLSDAATHHALAELVDASLMYRTTSGRYSAHDLTRLFASSRLARDCAPGDVHSARRRMFTWLLDAVMAASAWFQPGAMASRAGSLPVDSTDEAADWLRNEVENWHAALRWSSSSEGAHARVLHAVLALDWASDLLTQWDGGPKSPGWVGDPPRRSVTDRAKPGA